MSKFKPWAWLLLSLLTVPLPAYTSLYDDSSRDSTIADQRKRMRSEDSQELREAVDETQVLFMTLAGETRRQDKSVLDELLKDLRDDYKLPGAVGRAKRSLELSEEVLSIQTGIKQVQARMESSDEAAPAPPHLSATVQAGANGVDQDEQHLLGLQSDLLNVVEDLRSKLSSLHKDLKEQGVRDLRNWAMVSAGLLRHRREAAEAVAAREKAAEALPIDAGQVLPASLSAPASAQP